MRITLTINDHDIQRSVHAALKAKGRRLSVRDWVIRDLTEQVPFVTECRQSEWAKQENFRPLVAEAIGDRLTDAAFDAKLTEQEAKDIASGKAILSSDGGVYH